MSAATCVDVPAINLSDVVEQLEHQPQYRDWSRQRMESAVREYRIFLAIVKAYPDVPVIPGRDVGSLWQRHILNTKRHADDRRHFFGYFLHHNPHSGVNSSKKTANVDWQTTLREYEELFGEKPSEGWLNSQSICNFGCDGSKCSPGAGS